MLFQCWFYFFFLCSLFFNVVYLQLRNLLAACLLKCYYSNCEVFCFPLMLCLADESLFEPPTPLKIFIIKTPLMTQSFQCLNSLADGRHCIFRSSVYPSVYWYVHRKRSTHNQIFADMRFWTHFNIAAFNFC